VSDPPHNAETVADTGPRWINFTASFEGAPQFLGRAGPIDIWLDPKDDAVPFLAKGKTHQRWGQNAAVIIDICEHSGVHLTLHDECTIHQLCAPHNSTDQTPTPTETDND